MLVDLIFDNRITNSCDFLYCFPDWYLKSTPKINSIHLYIVHQLFILKFIQKSMTKKRKHLMKFCKYGLWVYRLRLNQFLTIFIVLTLNFFFHHNNACAMCTKWIYNSKRNSNSNRNSCINRKLYRFDFFSSSFCLCWKRYRH